MGDGRRKNSGRLPSEILLLGLQTECWKERLTDTIGGPDPTRDQLVKSYPNHELLRILCTSLLTEQFPDGSGRVLKTYPTRTGLYR